MPTPSPARMHDFEIVSNEKIAEGIFSLVISAPNLARALNPGQFVNLAVPGNAMSLLRIPLSYVTADADAGTVTIWYAVVGDGTQRLSQMHAGQTSDLLGPGGRGWHIPQDASRVLLVAGGIGVPPVLCLAELLCARGIAFDVCVGAATSTQLVGLDEFRAYGVGELYVATDDGSEGIHGFCTEPVANLMERNDYDYVATCGPAPMMKKVADVAAGKGVYCEASLERMMSCGFGACSTCNVETVNGNVGACMCGPVFDATKVVAW